MTQTTDVQSTTAAAFDTAAGPQPETPVELPEEAVEAELAQGDFGGIGAVTAVSAGGLTINLLFDTAAMNAPASFRASIQQAAAILTSMISDRITVNLKIDYSGHGGGAAAGPDGGQWMAYSTVRSNLVNNASPGDTTFNALPTGSSLQGQSYVAVWNSQLKLWGGLGANDATTDDGSATFATDINPSLLVGVALHELTHAFGRVPYGPQPDIFDFYRFSSPGVRLMTGGATASTAYFSLDGGYTKLADYGQSSDPSDFLNSGVQGGNDPFNEFYTSSTLQTLTAADLKQMDALGFHLVSATSVTIEALGSISLVQLGSSYFLNPVGGGIGPQIKFGGSTVAPGQLGGWAPIAAETSGTGYQVAWKMAGADAYTVWNIDSGGNYTGNAIGAVSGASAAFEAFETTFHQDLNGDGTIGIPTTVIEALGATSLVQAGNGYYLNPVGGGTGPQLKFGGANLIVGQLGGWTPIAADVVGSGYQIAWKMAGADIYTVWNSDSSGAYVGNAIGAVSGSSSALEALETNLHQDLNGDGTIGILTTIIEAQGSTSLVQSGSGYYLNPVGGGVGPQVKFGGSTIAVGQLGALTPIAAETSGSGYQIAWKVTGSDLYTVWNTDSSGNYTGNAIGAVNGINSSLEAMETSFHQDLNGDGTIGIPTTVIESLGSTSLVQSGSTYFLNPVGGGTGPQIMFGGSVIVVGQLGDCMPIAAETSGSGYQVAWKIAGTDIYTVWNIDSSGAYVGNAIGAVPGGSASLETLETSFHQDLNGDGTIGIPSHTGLLSAAAPFPTSADGPGVIATMSTGFSGSLIGFGKTADQIELKDTAYASLQAQFNHANGLLSVSDGANSTSLHFMGPLSADSFRFAEDGQGGTMISGVAAHAAASGPAPQSISLQGHDAFVFAEHFGQVSLSDFTPGTDTMTVSHNVFANQAALLAAIHDDPAGNAVITDAAQDTIMVQHVSTADLLAHLSSFHLV